MPKVSVSVPHQYDPDEVVKRAQPYLEEIVQDFEGHDLEMRWEGREARFHFVSLAFKISGHVVVDEGQILVELDLPIAAMLFKDKIQKSIRKHLTEAIGGDAAEPESGS